MSTKAPGFAPPPPTFTLWLADFFPLFFSRHPNGYWWPVPSSVSPAPPGSGDGLVACRPAGGPVGRPVASRPGRDGRPPDASDGSSPPRPSSVAEMCPTCQKCDSGDSVFVFANVDVRHVTSPQVQKKKKGSGGKKSRGDTRHALRSPTVAVLPCFHEANDMIDLRDGRARSERIKKNDISV